jgi:hypothetical protein
MTGVGVEKGLVSEAGGGGTSEKDLVPELGGAGLLSSVPGLGEGGRKGSVDELLTKFSFLQGSKVKKSGS